MDYIVVRTPPYEGRYEYEWGLTTTEYGWIKRLSGYVGDERIGDGLRDADPELVCVLAVIAMQRAGKIVAADVPDVFREIADWKFDWKTISYEIGEREKETDAGPPASSSSGNGDSSGADSTPSSESSESAPNRTGTPGSVTSESVPATSVN